VIASQAVISGAFSLTRQALQLGYCPRVDVRHTSSREIGQVYVPAVTWLLALAGVGLVVGFGSSEALAGAYGVAVSTTMVITTILLHRCARQCWGWSGLAAGVASAGFLVVDLAFFAANLTKVRDGGWFPLAVAALASLVMATWHRGRQLLGEELGRNRVAMEPFVRDIQKHPPVRAAGIAVFMDSHRTGVPRTLLHNLKHNRVLHETVVLLTVVTEEVPRVPSEERIDLEEVGAGFFRVVAHYGYMESPNVPAVLRQAREGGLRYDPMLTTFFLGRETLICSRRGGMARWRKRLFALMSRNAQRANAHFGLPPNRVVELGVEVTL
jgi:KUP system potassium uptake protein